ncbi:MAG: ABC transporter substrate-binding protein [Veillonella sp.]|nr:ABC transporter substrate-binding protein [Veillonella sp.]
MKRWLLACLTMLCMVALLVGCGSDTAKQGKQGKHMNVGLYWFGETLDPTHEWDAWTLTRIGAGETLATVTPDMKFAPQLADSWENVDPTTWKFHIRENVKFHNGTPMTPQKVKESIEYTMKQSARSAKAVKIESIAVDGQNLIIKTTEPNGSLLSSLTEPAFVIMDTADLKDVASKPVLTGPYKITSFKKGETIELAAFADYWGGKPGLDSVTVKDIEDNNKRAMALQSKDVDVIQKVDSANRSLFKDGFNIQDVAGVRVFMLKANNTIAHIINYDSMAKIIGNGSTPGAAPFPPSANLGYDAIANKPMTDVAKADQILTQAGYAKNANSMYAKDGKELAITIAIWGKDTSLYEEIQQELKKAGIAVTLKKLQSPDEVDTLGTDGFDLVERNVVTMSTNDPYWFLSLFYKTGAKANVGGYTNSQVDALIDQLSVTFDQNERSNIAKQAQQILVDDVADIYLLYPSATVVSTTKVKNVPVHPIDYYLLTKDSTIE